MFPGKLCSATTVNASLARLEKFMRALRDRRISRRPCPGQLRGRALPGLRDTLLRYSLRCRHRAPMRREAPTGRGREQLAAACSRRRAGNLRHLGAQGPAGWDPAGGRPCRRGAGLALARRRTRCQDLRSSQTVRLRRRISPGRSLRTAAALALPAATAPRRRRSRPAAASLRQALTPARPAPPGDPAD